MVLRAGDALVDARGHATGVHGAHCLSTISSLYDDLNALTMDSHVLVICWIAASSMAKGLPWRLRPWPCSTIISSMLTSVMKGHLARNCSLVILGDDVTLTGAETVVMALQAASVRAASVTERMGGSMIFGDAVVSASRPRRCCGR